MLGRKWLCEGLGVAAVVLFGCTAQIGGDSDPSGTALGSLTLGAPTPATGCLDPSFGASLRMRNDDSRRVGIAFPVSFYGSSYPTMWVNSNGNVTFDGPNPDAFNTMVPDGSFVMMAALYGDFNPSAGPSTNVFFNTVGTAPNRVMLVTWLAVPESGGSDPSTFQLQLHEADGAIIFTYDTIGTDGGNPDGSSMTAGISSGAGQDIVVASGSGIPALAGTAVRFDWNGSDYVATPGCDPPPPPPTNTAPVADAGPDAIVECTGLGSALVTLDGSGSFDPEGDALTYAWSEGGAPLASGEIVDVSLPLGVHDVDLSVADGELGDVDTVTIVVEDTAAPSLDVTVEATDLWPPNHTMRTVLSGVSASDACCDAAVTIHVSGDADDHEIIDHGDGTFDVAVRAERDGRDRDGRTYEIVVEAVDCAGNAQSETFEVHVPHDQRCKKH